MSRDRRSRSLARYLKSFEGIDGLIPPNPHSVTLHIPRATVDACLASQFAAATPLLKPGIRYRRTETMTADGMLVQWVEEPQPAPSKTVPPLCASKY